MNRNLIIAGSLAGLLAVTYALRDRGDTLPSGVETAVAMSVDGGRYDKAQLAETYHRLAAAGVPDAETIVQRFIVAGVAPDDIDLLATASARFAKASNRNVLSIADQVAKAFTSGPDSIGKLDEKFNFMTAEDRRSIRQLQDDGKPIEAMGLAKSILAVRLATVANL